MTRLGHLLVILALGVWIGAMTFFSFVVAPVAFGTLGREEAGRLVTAIFPIYYTVGGVAGGLALLVTLGLARAVGRARLLLLGTAALLVLAVALTVYAGGVLLPQVHQAKAEIQAAPTAAQASLQFSRLHTLAVALNVTVLLAVLTALVLSVLALPAGRGS